MTQVIFPDGLFSIDAVKRAAYQLSDRLVVDIQSSDKSITCDLRPISSEQEPSALEAEFRKAVLDYDLRARIAKETEGTRNLVLSLAFSKAGLQE